MDLARLAADPSLTPDAFRLLAYVASLGQGEHEVPSDVLRMLLRCRGDKPIYEARVIAQRHGLVWKQGGRGHANVYGYLAPQGGVSDTSPQETTQVTEYVPPQGEVNGYLAPGDDVSATVGGGSSSRKEKQVEQSRAHEDGFPQSYPLTDKAIAAIADQGEKFKGFRGALTDYLQVRVRPDRQGWYVLTIAAWMDGTDASVFRLADGSRVPTDEIPGLIATALNELLASGEKDAIPKPMKYGDGDPRNLKTKLGVLCRQRGDHKRPAPEQKAVSPDFGNETQRDRARAEEARRRSSSAAAAQQEAEQARTEDWRKETLAWFEALSVESRQAIEAEFESRTKTIGRLMGPRTREGILLGIIDERRKVSAA